MVQGRIHANVFWRQSAVGAGTRPSPIELGVMLTCCCRASLSRHRQKSQIARLCCSTSQCTPCCKVSPAFIVHFLLTLRVAAPECLSLRRLEMLAYESQPSRQKSFSFTQTASLARSCSTCCLVKRCGWPCANARSQARILHSWRRSDRSRRARTAPSLPGYCGPARVSPILGVHIEDLRGCPAPHLASRSKTDWYACLFIFLHIQCFVRQRAPCTSSMSSAVWSRQH